MSAPSVVLTIAGFDPSSGAGITADLKTIAAHGCYGTACITALTVQSTRGVCRVEPVSVDVVRDTLAELASDLPPAAVHVGMLGSGAVAEAVADFLETCRAPLVLDTILRSTSGAEMLDAAALEVLRGRLLKRAAVVTPNLAEAAVLGGGEVRTLEDMKAVAVRLHALGAKAVVVKGGHLQGEEAVDLLSECGTGAGPTVSEFRRPKLASRGTHGTGCAFATAIACNLALGRGVREAVGRAKQYVATAIEHAQGLGQGNGPMHHLFRLDGE